MLQFYFVLLLSVCGSHGIIYQLNDTEYQQLPQLFELDDYELCLGNSGIYCMVNLELYGKPENKIFNLINEYTEHYTKHFNYTKIDRGICVTKSCDNYINDTSVRTNDGLQQILQQCIDDTLGKKYNLAIKLNSVNCEQDQIERKIDKLDYLVAAVIILLCIAVIVGTCYDLHNNEDIENLGTAQKSLLCFSILRNTKKLLQVDKDTQDRWIGFDGVRVIAQFLIVYGHAIYLFALLSKNPHDFEKSYENPFQRLIFSSTSIIQLFFVISGFLVTYVLQVTEEKRLLSWSNLPQLIFTRWWRLAPSLAIVIGFMATWFRHLGSGPLWKRNIINGVSYQCQKYYWAHLFFFNNYLPDDNLCSLESWYVATDIQLFILGLLVHFLIRKRSWRFKTMTLSLLVFIGIICPFLHVYLQELDAYTMLKPELFRTLTDRTLDYYHKFSYNNVSCYIIGMATGYLAYDLKQRKLEFPHSKIGNFLSWVTIPALASVSLVGTTFYQDKPTSIASRALFASCHRILLGLIMSLNILGVVLKCNGFSRNTLEWSGWRVPSRLSYCVYLIHDNLIHYVMSVRTQLITFSAANVVVYYVGIITLSEVLALLLYLLVESPANQLFKIYINSNRNKMKKS